MVYNKIRDKIPSLSSLLLAGLVLGTGAIGCKSEAPVSTNSSAGQSNAQPQPVVPPVAAGQGQLGTELHKFWARTCKYIVEHCTRVGQALSVTYPSTLKQFQLNDKDSAKVKKEVERFFDSFDDNNKLAAYPKDLRGQLQLLSYMPKFATGTSSGLPNKRQYGAAVALISSTVCTLYRYVESVLLELSKGVDWDKGKLNDLCKAIEKFRGGLSGKFALTAEFYTSEGASLIMDNPIKLMKFFNETDSKGGPQTASQKKSGMEKVLQEGVDVLVINRKAEGSLFSEAMNEKDVNRLGGVAKDVWKILGADGKESTQKMFEVAKFPADLEYVFNLDASATQEDASIQARGEEKHNLKLNQLLISLFTARGSVPNRLQFLSLSHEQNDPDQTVRCVGNYKTFSELFSLSKQSDDDFAMALGEHIVDDATLKDFFFIPDKDAIMHAILKNVSSFDNIDDIANKGGSAANSDYIVGGTIGTRSLSRLILQNVCTGLFDSTKACDDKLMKDLADAYQKESFNKTTASFNQRLAARIISELLYGEKPVSSSAGKLEFDKNSMVFKDTAKSGTSLIARLENIVDTALDDAIVFRAAGRYKPTKVTNQIIAWIHAIDGALAKLHNAEKVTYQLFEKSLNDAIDKHNNALPATTVKKSYFSITALYKKLDEYCVELENACKADVSGLLDSKTEDSFFSSLGLSKGGDEYDTIIRYREDYLKASAPVPGPAPTLVPPPATAA